jgi:hypothetical protein
MYSESERNQVKDSKQIPQIYITSHYDLFLPIRLGGGHFSIHVQISFSIRTKLPVAASKFQSPLTGE